MKKTINVTKEGMGTLEQHLTPIFHELEHCIRYRLTDLDFSKAHTISVTVSEKE